MGLKMKFGLEVEKFLFDLKKNCPSDGVLGFINALTDLELYRETDPVGHVTNEFVLNLIEFTTEPMTSPVEVIRKYLQNYVLLKSVAMRESVTIVPMGSLPLEYQPHMIPKWQYFVQNSILAGKIQNSWEMGPESALTAAGNCAGMHVHAEIETPLEYLFSNRELQDKFNLGIMLSPMIAFSSSPFFFGEHVANCMRGLRYYLGVYREFPNQGGLPPVMNSSSEVLSFFQNSEHEWLMKAKEIGLPFEDMRKLVRSRGASWNPVRWNKQWNTIELRCFDSDLTDLDAAKFIWVCGAYKRLEQKDYQLTLEPMADEELSMELIQQAFQINDGVVSILSNKAIQELFKRAIQVGLHDALVVSYLSRLAAFALEGVEASGMAFYERLLQQLEGRSCSADKILDRFPGYHQLSQSEAIAIINYSIENESKVINHFEQVLH